MRSARRFRPAKAAARKWKEPRLVRATAIGVRMGIGTTGHAATVTGAMGTAAIKLGRAMAISAAVLVPEEMDVVRTISARMVRVQRDGLLRATARPETGSVVLALARKAVHPRVAAPEALARKVVDQMAMVIAVVRATEVRARKGSAMADRVSVVRSRPEGIAASTTARVVAGRLSRRKRTTATSVLADRSRANALRIAGVATVA